MPRRSFSESFRDAWTGLVFCVRSQRNMQIHLVAAAAVLMAVFWLGLSRIELAVVVFAISFVLVAEMFNTAVEKTIDLYTTAYHPIARLAKHIAAGAVLIAAVNAVATGLLVILPHIQALW
ncbi:MAG: diacylglycerol kinase family protein [Thermacetogeniaceae bacterium]